MRTDKIRKYLIPNIPYLFILWAFLKLGTAYRLAAGNDFAHKLIGLGQTIGPAFADFAPGLAPLDWLVGSQVTSCLYPLYTDVYDKHFPGDRGPHIAGSVAWVGL